MKTSRLFLFVATILVSSILLSACAGGGVVNTSWPGVKLAKEGDTVYVSNATHVYAVNAGNGSQVWRFPEKADNKTTFFAPVALTEDGQVIAGSYNKLLYSLKENGQQNWTFDKSTGTYVAGALIVGEKILAPSSDYNLYSLNLDGTPGWVFPTQGALWGAPVSDGKLAFLASMDHHVYAVDLASGKQVWQSEDVQGAMGGSPTLGSDGLLYVGTLDSSLFALQTNSGKLAWSYPTQGWVWTGPLLDEGVLYFGDLAGYIYAIDAKTGSEIWKVQLESGDRKEITGNPLLLDRKLYFVTQGGNLFIVDKTNGGVIKKTFVDKAQFFGPPVQADETIYVGAMGTAGLLFAFDLDGNQRWTFTPPK